MTIGSIIVWIIVGLIAGALAKWIMPGPDPGGIILTIIIGVIGAFIGGYILQAIGIGSGPFGQFNVPSIITAVIGALILLVIYRFLTRRVA